MLFGILFTLSILTGLIGQVLLPVPFWGGDVFLPLLTGLVVYYALMHRFAVAGWAALLGGLLADGFSLGQAGIWLAYYVLAVYAANRFRRQIVPDAAITAAVFGMTTNLGITMTQYLVLLSGGYRSGSVLQILARCLWSLGSAAICTPLLCVWMHKLYRGLDLVTGEEGQHVNA